MQRVSFDWEIWSCCCLNFHWLSFQELPLKVEKGCPSPSHSFWIFLCWFEGSLWSFEIFLGGYLRQARNHCKSVPESTKLTYAYKTKESILPRNLVIVFSTKLHPLYLLYPMTWRCCLMHLIKQNCLLKSFLRTLILTTQAFLYLHSLLELIWNYIMFMQLTI